MCMDNAGPEQSLVLFDLSAYWIKHSSNRLDARVAEAPWTVLLVDPL